MCAVRGRSTSWRSTPPVRRRADRHPQSRWPARVPCRTRNREYLVIAGRRRGPPADAHGRSAAARERRQRRRRLRAGRRMRPVRGRADHAPWFHEDDLCWIAECEICEVPMVVWRFHGTRPPTDHLAHMLEHLARWRPTRSPSSTTSTTTCATSPTTTTPTRAEGGFFGRGFRRLVAGRGRAASCPTNPCRRTCPARGRAVSTRSPSAPAVVDAWAPALVKTAPCMPRPWWKRQKKRNALPVGTVSLDRGRVARAPPLVDVRRPR